MQASVLEQADAETVARLAPELSVVIVVLNGGASLARCLDALRPQMPPERLEILVPCDARLPDAAEFQRRYPEVSFLPLPGRRPYAALRSSGLRAARGRVLAITEDQCIPPPQWCANVLEAHAAPHAAIGGPMEKQQPDTALGWAIYLREFTSYIPPVAEGPSESLTDANVSYKRAALEAIRDVWAEAFHEPQVHGALRERGETLWLSPALLTYQQRTMDLGEAVGERFAFGRLYGSLRVAGAPPARRLLLLAGSVLLPAVLLGRVIVAVVRKGRYFGPCLLALPHLALFATVWSCGEFTGYLTGRGGKRSEQSGA